MNATTNVDPWLTVADVAREYNAPRTTVVSWFRVGVRGRRIVGALLIGGKWKAKRSDIQAFFDALTLESVGDLTVDARGKVVPTIDIEKPETTRKRIADVAEDLKKLGIDMAKLPEPRKRNNQKPR